MTERACPDEVAPPKGASPRRRAEHVLRTLPSTMTDAHVVVSILSAALDAEELAHEFYRQGAYCGDCDFDGWASCPVCRQVCRDYAVALRDFALRGPA